VVTGVGERFALAGRLATGPLAGRIRWPLVLAGYGLTMLAVPTLGLATGLWAAAGLVTAERAGKAIRSPTKDVMISYAAGAVGHGKGFAVREALDQAGAAAGPLLVAAAVAATADNYRTGFGMLALPAAAVMGLLWWLRTRVRDRACFEPDPSPQPHPLSHTAAIGGARLPDAFLDLPVLHGDHHLRIRHLRRAGLPLPAAGCNAGAMTWAIVGRCVVSHLSSVRKEFIGHVEAVDEAHHRGGGDWCRRACPGRASRRRPPGVQGPVRSRPGPL
jgi:hypothetical protein